MTITKNSTRKYKFISITLNTIVLLILIYMFTKKDMYNRTKDAFCWNYFKLLVIPETDTWPMDF